MRTGLRQPVEVVASSPEVAEASSPATEAEVVASSPEVAEASSSPEVAAASSSPEVATASSVQAVPTGDFRSPRPLLPVLQQRMR